MVRIRWLERKDCESLILMIKELKAVEKNTEIPNIFENDLIRDAFSVPPLFYCFIAEENEENIGFCMFNIAYETNWGKRIYVEDLLVKEKYRKLGLGSAFLQCVAKYAKDNGYFRVSLISKPSNDIFYRKLGFENISETKKYEMYSISVDDMDKLLTDRPCNEDISFQL